MNTYREVLQTARSYLKQHDIADADVDAWYLLAHVFGINRTDYVMNGEKPVPKEKLMDYWSFVELRASHIPLQHITGTQEFMGLEFEVTKDVLIPRQDTEILVEEVLKVCEQKTVLDMCTGSGCIIISLARLGNLKKATGADVSMDAIAIATKNAYKHNVDVEFIHSDLFQRINGVYDIIVSNPPYIPSGEIDHLMPEVRDHEPLVALDGEEDGLIFYRRIAVALKSYLKQDGYIFFEIGHNQGKDVKEILVKEGFRNVTVKKDLSGLDRVVFGIRN
jgi:release factor glutamine methyltransferase